MLASPLFSKYYDKNNSNNETKSITYDRKWFLFGVNTGVTYIISLITYILSFTGTLSYNINTMLYSNHSINSILTPEPWTQYLQWTNYVVFLIPLITYISKYENKDTKLKLYELSPYLIVLNLIQLMTNLLPYKDLLCLGIKK